MFRDLMLDGGVCEWRVTEIELKEPEAHLFETINDAPGNGKRAVRVRPRQELSMPLLLCILLATTLVICAQKPEREAALAAHLTNEIRRGTKPLGSTLVQEYVERVGRGLAATLAGPSVPFVYAVVFDGIGGRTRELEKRADAMAVKMTSAAGYDPEALARYIGRVQPDDTERSRKSSPLPPRAIRIAALSEAIQQLPQKAYPASSDFTGIQDEVRRALRPVESDRPPTLRRPGENQP